MAFRPRISVKSSRWQLMLPLFFGTVHRTSQRSGGKKCREVLFMRVLPCWFILFMVVPVTPWCAEEVPFPKTAMIGRIHVVLRKNVRFYCFLVSARKLCRFSANLHRFGFSWFSASSKTGKSVRRQFFPPFDFKTMFCPKQQKKCNRRMTQV